MEQKTYRQYPGAPFENNDLKQRLEKKLKDVNSFNNQFNNIKEMITYFKDKYSISRKKYKNYKMITTILKSFDTIVIIATTFSFITLSPPGIRLITIPISSGIACGLRISKKVIDEIFMLNYNKYKKPYENDQQSIKSFNNLYRKTLQDNVINRDEYQVLCNVFTKHLHGTKIGFF